MSFFRNIVGMTAGAIIASAGFAAPVAAQAPKVQVALGDTISVETLAYLVALERAKDRGVDYNLTSFAKEELCLLYTSPSPRDGLLSRMPSSA